MHTYKHACMNTRKYAYKCLRIHVHAHTHANIHRSSVYSRILISGGWYFYARYIISTFQGEPGKLGGGISPSNSSEINTIQKRTHTNACRHTHTRTDRDTYRYRYIDTHTDRQLQTQVGRQMHAHVHAHTCGHTHMCGHTTHTGIQHPHHTTHTGIQHLHHTTHTHTVGHGPIGSM